MEKTYRRPFRDSGCKVFGGVCSGLAFFFGTKPFVMRLAFTGLFLMATAGAWIYLALWLILPLAEEPGEQCELRGLPKSAENLAKFTKETKTK